MSMLKGMRISVADEIVNRVGGVREFFTYTSTQIAALIGRELTAYPDSYRRNVLEKAKRELEWIEKNNIKPLYYADDAYPERLRQCEDAPLMLYGTGQCELNDALFLSIVGTRHATVYGISFVERLVEELAAKMSLKPVIVSGLAYGIDIAAHKAALKHGLPTIAVLAHGLSMIYPASHRDTAARIACGGGMLLTEYTSDSRTHRSNFLARNRIVAGISDCVLVVESASHGGAMVTARLGREYNREVCALPGRVGDTYSAGCNDLIMRQVAALVSSADDIARLMGWEMKDDVQEGAQAKIPLFDLPPEKQAIVEYIEKTRSARLNTMSIDLGIPVSKLNAWLVELEFKGLVKCLPGGIFTT